MNDQAGRREPPTPPARGPWLGVDVGTVRVGAAVSDPDGLLATPVTTLPRDQGDQGDTGDLAALVALVADRGVTQVIVGLPRSLSGTEGPAARAARAYARALAQAVRPVPVRLVDERMSTVTAQRALHAAGRTVRSSRAVVDQAAAVVILQSALDIGRSTGRPPGRIVEVDR